MQRRPLLAALPAAAGLAGCAGRSRTDGQAATADRPLSRTATMTPLEPAPASFPDHPDPLTRATARRFVERYAEATVRAALRERSTPPIVAFSVEDARSAVVRGAGPGYLLTSACAGSVRYRREPDGSGRGYGVNADGVVHHVGPDRHTPVSGTGYACVGSHRDPYRAGDSTRNVAAVDGDSDADPDTDSNATTGADPFVPAALRLYDFGPDDDPARLRVTVTDATGGGGLVVREDFRFQIPAADHRFRVLVRPRVTVAAGRYRLHVDVVDGGATTVDWTLPRGGGHAWYDTCLGVRPDGEPVVVTVTADGDLGLGDVGCRVPAGRVRGSS